MHDPSCQRHDLCGQLPPQQAADLSERRSQGKQAQGRVAAGGGHDRYRPGPCGKPAGLFPRAGKKPKRASAVGR